ncbi:PDZ domain-containing protein [bacterium]|nr:PDZ domain-containing protein [bacterium]
MSPAIGQVSPSPQENTGSLGTFSIPNNSLTETALVEDSPFTLDPPAKHPDQFTKRGSDLADSLRAVTNKNRASVVSLTGSTKPQGNHSSIDSILGTLVSTNGLIVSKYSIAKEMRHCVFQDGQKWPFRIIGFDEKKDLCLIRVNRRGLTPIKFRSDLGEQNVNLRQQGFEALRLIPPTAGSLALSVGHEDKIAAFGMVTMGLHDFKIQQPQCPDCVDLGMTVSPYPSLSRVNGVVYPLRKGIKVLRVYPRSVGERVGLLVGDLINTVNGTSIYDRQILDQETKKVRAGDVMTMKVFRKGLPRELTYKVPAVKKTLHDRWGGGPYSDRRFGFGPVIVHDSVLAPQDCGGPLVDVQGNVIGVNISRSMRVASFAINIEDVYLFVKSRSPETKLLFQD